MDLTFLFTNICRSWVGSNKLHVVCYVPFTIMERPCNTLKGISLAKKVVHFGLFLGFLVLSTLAFLDLYSGTKTIQVNKIKQEFITNFPSFSVCTEVFVNQSQLANGVLDQLPFKTRVFAGLKYKSNRKWILWIDMLNQNELMDHIDGSWDTYCKLFSFHTAGCLPCLTFRFNSFKMKDVEKANFGAYFEKTSDDEYGVLVTLHDQNQSMLLKDSFDWSHTFYLAYRLGIK